MDVNKILFIVRCVVLQTVVMVNLFGACKVTVRRHRLCYSVVSLFPGQGTQFVGMGKNIYTVYPYCKELMDQADQVLGIKISQLMFNGPISELSATENCQPAIFLNSFLQWHVLEKGGQRIGGNGNWVLGHSIGEYAALVASGYLSFKEALMIVRNRGICMAKYGKNESDPLGMIAVMFSPSYSLEIDELAEKGNVEIANYNSSQWVIISGHLSKLKSTALKWKSDGIILAFRQLQVSGAFHSSFMEKPLREFSLFLDKCRFSLFDQPRPHIEHQFFSSCFCKPVSK